MGNFPLSALWLNLIVISGTWGSSFVLVKLITESMHPFAFAASRGFITMLALLVWLALRNRTAPSYYRAPLPSQSGDNLGADGVHYNLSPHCARGTFVAAARKPRAGERS